MQEESANNIETWRTRPEIENTLSDVYDGKIWKDFMSVDGEPFLAQPYSLAMALNVGWFQPYKWSVGVIYLTVLNLPCHIRYKREHVLLLGIIPGPKEPKQNINSYLRLLVCELLELWKGVTMQVYSKGERKIQGAVICVCCDMPASRKACGFLGHTATLSCTKCEKEFGGGFGDKDYSGFDREKWLLRSNVNHRACVDSINCQNLKEPNLNLYIDVGIQFCWTYLTLIRSV